MTLPSSALLTTKFVWPRDEFPARTIMKRHPEERLLAATNLLFPGLAMSVAERTEQQVPFGRLRAGFRPRVRPQDDASYFGVAVV